MPRKILIVDDMTINRQILKGALCKDYEILEAANGKEALSVLLSTPRLSAVLLDIVMPEMDGYEVLARMRESDALSQIPVIMVTGSEEEDARVKCLSLGANDFVTKPYNPDIIRHCLRNNIALRETASLVNAIQKDKLTGLYTREAFFEKAAAMLHEHAPGHYLLACLDINNFKSINDQFGAAEGDRMLRFVGHTVLADMEEIGGVGCRVSADNFAMLYPAAALSVNLLERLQNRRDLPELLRASTSFAVGRYIVTETDLPVATLYDRAYLAKRSIKGRYDEHIAYFDDSMLDALNREHEIISDMDVALTTGQFEVWFQPQFNHSTGALIGSEALVRWRHPVRGLIPPGVFIPVFESNGFIYELDKFVWAETCRYLKKWRDEGRHPLPVSVNVSRYDIFRADLIDVITGCLTQFELPTELLRLEITESAFASSTKQIVEIVKQLIDLGFTLEIDDFGSGYSSLNTLKSVPAQIVKLDMRFLEGDDDSERGGNILESMVRMARWLDMAVIAEGVETLAQANFLRSIGCSYVQGYLYARPMPAADYEKLCKGSCKEQRLLAMESVESLDNNAFWNPNSMDTLIFNSYVDGACIFEYDAPKFELVRANDQFASILGSDTLTTDDILKLDWIGCLDSDGRETVRQMLARAIETGDEQTAEYLFLHIPGCPEKTYLRSTMRIIASAGSRHLVYCRSTNITAQREAEQKERQTAERMQAVMDNVGVGITATVLNGNDATFLFSNNRYYEILGYTKAQYEAEVSNPFVTVCPEDLPWVAERTAAISREHASDVLEFRALRRDGRVIWVRSAITTGRFGGVAETVQLATYLDITEALETESQLHLLTNSIPGGIATYEWNCGKLRPTYFSDGYCRLFGLDREQYALDSAINPFAHVSEGDIPMLRAELDALIAENKPVDCTILAHSAEGADKWINIKALASERRRESATLNAVIFDVTNSQLAMERLRVSEEMNRLALAHTGHKIGKFDVAARTLTLPATNAIFSLSPVVEDIPDGPIARGEISPETAEAYAAFYEGILRGEETGSAVYQRISRQGWRWIEAHFTTIFNDAGEPVSAVVSYGDVTERMEKESVFKRWQQSMQGRRAEDYTLFRCNLTKDSSFDTAEGSLLHIAFREGVFHFNDRTLEYAEQYVFEEDRAAYTAFVNSDAMLASYYRGKRYDSIEYREKLPEGGVRWLKLTVDLVEYPNSTDIEAYLMYESIDESKRAELIAIERAETDALTGVLNRTTFAARVDAVLSHAKNEQHALLMLDLDGFKQVNDAFGHGAGDQALIDVAHSLRAALRQGDLLCRLGGDEFLLLLRNIPNELFASTKARQICALTRKAFSVNVQISGSVGIAVSPRDGESFSKLYQRADRALYCVKDAGKDDFAFYQEGMGDSSLALRRDASEAGNGKPLRRIRRMLIVDDSRVDFELLANLFSDEFVIDKAHSGSAALARLRHYGSAISVVLLDLMMPGMDGFDILNKMQESAELSGIPVVVVSAMDDRQTSLKAIRLGASDYVNKPVDPELLKLRVQSAVGKAENERIRARAGLIELQSEETRRYKTALAAAGAFVIEHNWLEGTFTFDPSISLFLAGKYDGRMLWQILLSDMVADTLTVQQMQGLVHRIVADRLRTEGTMLVRLQTPSKTPHWFKLHVSKQVNEMGLASKLLLTLCDLGEKRPEEA